MARFAFDPINVSGESKVTIYRHGEIINTTQAALDAEKRRARAKAARNKKKVQTTTLMNMSREQAIKLVKSVKVLKSLCAYYDHGYRQWGVVCRDNVINNKFISAPFVKVRNKAREINTQMELLNAERKNSKDIYQLIEKLSYLVDDITKEMQNLVKGITESHVCEDYKGSEMIFGEGRRLGLTILVQRTLLSLLDMENIFKEINAISVKGADISDYNPHGTFSKF